VPEGIEGRVPYKGTWQTLVTQLVGGLRFGHGLYGLSHDQGISGKDSLLRITSAGLRESHVHDVIITKEAPELSFGIIAVIILISFLTKDLSDHCRESHGSSRADS